MHNDKSQESSNDASLSIQRASVRKGYGRREAFERWELSNPAEVTPIAQVRIVQRFGGRRIRGRQRRLQSLLNSFLYPQLLGWELKAHFAFCQGCMRKALVFRPYLEAATS